MFYVGFLFQSSYVGWEDLRRVHSVLSWESRLPRRIFGPRRCSSRSAATATRRILLACLSPILLGATACASEREVASCGLLFQEPRDGADALAAGLTVEYAPVGGRDILTLWLCSARECAPAVRVRDQSGLSFRWQSDGVLSVATFSQEPELLRGAAYFGQEIVLENERDGSLDLESKLPGTGQIGGFGHSRCVFGKSPSFAGRAILSE